MLLKNRLPFPKLVTRTTDDVRLVLAIAVFIIAASSSLLNQVSGQVHQNQQQVFHNNHQTHSSTNLGPVQQSELIPAPNSQAWIGNDLEQASLFKDSPQSDKTGKIPADFVPWWDPAILKQTKISQTSVGVDTLVQSALLHSPFVKAIRTEPRIRQSQLCAEAAAFDWTAFLESSYNNVNDPIGNTLTTGNNASRFIDQQWSARGGVRRRNPFGGQFEIGQRFGRQRNNSIFLDPNPQGTSRLELNFTQPLLNGAGRVVNESRIVIAQLGQVASSASSREQLQEHLFRVTEAYWRLYQAKARFQQRNKLLGAAVSIYDSLNERRKLDAQYGQILRARSAVAKRKSELARIETDIRNAEAELRLLVNDPILIRSRTSEFVLTDAPSYRLVPLSMADSISTALQYRPDIAQAIQTVSSASVRLGVAKNDLLPRLDLVVGTYLTGLASRGESLNAWSRQFSEGGPGYSVGLQFEVPLGNRVAKARQRQRQFEFMKAQSEFEGSIQTALNEVELAVREVRTSHRELTGKFEAMTAAEEETKYLTDRFKTLPGDDVSANLMLEQLLESQERLADEEFAFVTAQVTYSVSLVNLRRAMGTLLMFDQTNNKTATTNQDNVNTIPLPSKGLQQTENVSPPIPGNVHQSQNTQPPQNIQRPISQMTTQRNQPANSHPISYTRFDSHYNSISQPKRIQPISYETSPTGRVYGQPIENPLWADYSKNRPSTNSTFRTSSGNSQRVNHGRR